MDTRVRYLVSDHDNPNMEEQSFLPEPSHRPEPTTPTPNTLILNSQNGSRNSSRPKYVFRRIIVLRSEKMQLPVKNGLGKSLLNIKSQHTSWHLCNSLGKVGKNSLGKSLLTIKSQHTRWHLCKTICLQEHHWAKLQIYARLIIWEAGRFNPFIMLIML